MTGTSRIRTDAARAITRTLLAMSMAHAVVACARTRDEGARSDAGARPSSADAAVEARSSRAVPAGEPCGLFEAPSDDDDAGESLAWSECGEGCLAASLTRGSMHGVRGATTARNLDDGDIAIRLVTEGGGRRLVRVLRMTTGEALATVEQRSRLGSCVPLGLAAGAPLVVAFFDADRGVLVGRADTRRRGKLRWSSRWATTTSVPTSSFDTGAAFGATFDDGTVALLDEASSAWRVVDRGQTSHRSDAQGDLVVWTRIGHARGDVIVGSLRGGAPTTLVEHDADAHVAALSTDALVWIATRGPDARTGTYDDARILRLRRDEILPGARPEAGSPLRGGVTLPAKSGLADLVTHGDAAATIGCPARTPATAPDRCELFVADLAGGRLLRSPARAGTVLRAALAISATEVLVGEADLGAPPQRIDRLVRIARASLH